MLVSDDDRIIIPGRDLIRKGFPVGRGEVIFCRNQQLRCRVVASKLLLPLSKQILRDNDHRLFYSADLPQLHCRRGHFKRLARAGSMRKERISA